MTTPAYLLDHIQDSVKALLDGSAPSDQLMFFAGNQQESIPAALFLDPSLRPVDRNLWVVLRLSIRSGNAFPSYQDLEHTWCVGSRDTLSISYALLRLRGWITRCHTVRDAQGRYRGQIWVVHDEPSPLGEILDLDPEYMAFFEDCRTHRSARIKAAACAMEAALEAAINRGEDVTALTSPIQRRMVSMQARSEYDGVFFGVDLAVLQQQRQQGHTPGSKQQPNQIIGLGEIGQVRNSDSGNPGQIIGLGEKSDSVTPSQIIGLGDKSLFFNEKSFHDKAGTVVALNSKSSSSNLRTTTLDLGESSSQISAMDEPLSYPKQLTEQLTENDLGLMRRYLNRAPAKDRQGILDYFAQRLATGKVDKPIPFLMSIVAASKDGRFYLHQPAQTAPPATTSPGGRDPLATYKLQRLHAEASGLRALIQDNENQTLRTALEAQLAEIEQQINEIKTTGVVQ